MLYKRLLDKTKELTSARDILGGANTFNGKKVDHLLPKRSRYG